MKCVELDLDYLQGLTKIETKSVIMQKGLWKEILFSTVYIDYISKKAYKIYEDPSFLTNHRLYKIEYFNQLDLNYATNPDEFSLINNVVRGFSMDYFPSKTIDTLDGYKDYYLKIHLLRKAKQALNYFHSRNIIVGDVHGKNILYNEELDIVKFTDVDSFLLNPNEKERIWSLGKRYRSFFGVVDQTCDIFLFNIVCLSILCNTMETCIIDAIMSKDIIFKTNDFNQIIQFILSFKDNSMKNGFIIDYLPDTKKEFKKMIKCR